MLIDNHAIAQGEALRAQLDLAAKVAAWEAKNGPVETQPIRPQGKTGPFRISCPEKKQAARAKALATRKAKAADTPLRKRGILASAQQAAKPGCAEYQRQRGRANAERVVHLYRQGVERDVIAQRVGISSRAVNRHIAAEGLRA